MLKKVINGKNEEHIEKKYKKKRECKEKKEKKQNYKEAERMNKRWKWKKRWGRESIWERLLKGRNTDEMKKWKSQVGKIQKEYWI